MAVGHDAVWVAVAAPELVVVDLSGGTTQITLPRPAAAVTSTAGGVLVALTGHGWNASPILILDPTTHRVIRTAQLPNPAVAAAADTFKAWVVGNDWSGDGQLIASVLLRRGNPVGVGAMPSANSAPRPICVSAAQGALWIPAQGERAVWHVSAVGDVKSTPLPARPTCVAATSRAVWLSSPDGAVLKFDSRRGRTKTILHTSASPSAIAVGFDRIWVTAS
jgi:hypothetical protein